MTLQNYAVNSQNELTTMVMGNNNIVLMHTTSSKCAERTTIASIIAVHTATFVHWVKLILVQTNYYISHAIRKLQWNQYGSYAINQSKYVLCYVIPI